MLSKKGYLTAEFVVVVLVFMIILVGFVASFNTLIPSEVEKIRSQTACLEADLLSNTLLNFPGENTSWHLAGGAGDLTKLGLSTSSFGELNYSKWVAAQNYTFVNVINKTGLNRSFLVKYSTYVFQPPTTYKSSVDDNPGPQEHIEIYFENASNIGVYGKNADGNRTVTANIELFFPRANISETNTSFVGSTMDATDNTKITNVSEGGSVEITFKMSNDSDQVKFNLSSSPELVFIKRLDFNVDTAAFSRDYPVYLNKGGISPTTPCNPKKCPENGTLLKDSFGSSGFVDPDRNYCEIKRKVVMVNESHKLGVDISILAER